MTNLESINRVVSIMAVLHPDGRVAELLLMAVALMAACSLAVCLATLKSRPTPL